MFEGLFQPMHLLVIFFHRLCSCLDPRNFRSDSEKELAREFAL